MRSFVENFEKALRVLRAVHSLPVATTLEIQEKVLEEVTLRTTQRYLSGLEEAGYLRKISGGKGFDRFFLTDKGRNVVGGAE